MAKWGPLVSEEEVAADWCPSSDDVVGSSDDESRSASPSGSPSEPLFWGVPAEVAALSVPPTEAPSGALSVTLSDEAEAPAVPVEAPESDVPEASEDEGVDDDVVIDECPTADWSRDSEEDFEDDPGNAGPAAAWAEAARAGAEEDATAGGALEGTNSGGGGAAAAAASALGHASLPPCASPWHPTSPPTLLVLLPSPLDPPEPCAELPAPAADREVSLTATARGAGMGPPSPPAAPLLPLLPRVRPLLLLLLPPPPLRRPVLAPPALALPSTVRSRRPSARRSAAVGLTLERCSTALTTCRVCGVTRSKIEAPRSKSGGYRSLRVTEAET